ncbi:MAG: LUD domain-containing protein [Bacteroidota bacterium]
MIATQADFTKESKKVMADTAHRIRIASYNKNYSKSFNESAGNFNNLELARKRAARLRWKIINHLDKYLIEFESNVIRSGGKVIWAQDNNEALESIQSILNKQGESKFIARSNAFSRDLANHPEWKKNGVEVMEVDYGNFILHADQDQASHTIIPALHKSSAEIADAFAKHFDLKSQTPVSIASLIRNEMRHSLMNASVAVSGAQFLIADEGAAVLSDDEGATLYTTSFPKTNIIIAGIDSILTGLQDLDLLLPLYSTYSAGEPLRAYNTIVKGPKQPGEFSGAEELYIILIDNGKTEILAQEEQRQVLSCINCGACLPASSIYKTVGGKAYPGPAQSIAAPMTLGSEYKYLADLATLDGSGSEACPVKINFPKLILHNRKNFVEQGLNSNNEKLFYYAWKKAMLKRDIMSWTGINARNKVLESYYKSKEGLRKMPSPVPKSFNQQWREKMGYK